jgi:hypothetical protein
MVLVHIFRRQGLAEPVDLGQMRGLKGLSEGGRWWDLLVDREATEVYEERHVLVVVGDI